MSEERLSKLQKWILVEAYKKGQRHVFLREDHERYHNDQYFSNKYFIHSKEVHERFYGRRPSRTQSAKLSRSISNMREKGYLEQITRLGHRHSGGKAIVLSGYGVQKAKSIRGSITEPAIQ